MKKLHIYLIILALFAIIVFLAFNFVNTPEYKFAELHAKEMEKCADASYTFTPAEVARVILNTDKNTILVDVRSKHDFVNGHIPNAKHISKSTILEKENYQFFSELKKEKKKVIFYGKEVAEANIAFMILKQMGIENIGISCEGYDFFIENDIHHIASTKRLFPNNETPITNFANYISITKQKAIAKQKEEKEKLKKVAAQKRWRTKKKSLVKAKSKPAIEEEEEEGC